MSPRKSERLPCVDGQSINRSVLDNGVSGDENRVVHGVFHLIVSNETPEIMQVSVRRLEENRHFFDHVVQVLPRVVFEKRMECLLSQSGFPIKALRVNQDLCFLPNPIPNEKELEVTKGVAPNDDAVARSLLVLLYEDDGFWFDELVLSLFEFTPHGSRVSQQFLVVLVVFFPIKFLPEMNQGSLEKY